MNDSARFNSQKAILEKYVKLFPNECWQEMLDILVNYEDSKLVDKPVVGDDGRAKLFKEFIQESFDRFDSVYKALSDDGPANVNRIIDTDPTLGH